MFNGAFALWRSGSGNFVTKFFRVSLYSGPIVRSFCFNKCLNINHSSVYPKFFALLYPRSMVTWNQKLCDLIRKLICGQRILLGKTRTQLEKRQILRSIHKNEILRLMDDFYLRFTRKKFTIDRKEKMSSGAFQSCQRKETINDLLMRRGLFRGDGFFKLKDVIAQKIIYLSIHKFCCCYKQHYWYVLALNRLNS